MSLTDFYKDKDIFITGGSGFMGKVLIEKLLRSCPDIKRIFLLLRIKKAKLPENRIFDIINVPLFDKIRKDCPEQFEKLIPISGDVAAINLGLSKMSETLMENVSIIFHVAANVRFDDPLKYAILMNARGTREVVEFALKLKQLRVLLHVSTTYCNPDKHIIEEKIYPAYGDWNTAIKLAEKFSPEILNILNAKYTNYQPNTYTFTKNLAEHIINDYKKQLPVLIYRPSIVISSIQEPFPGWIDSFNGPVGMLLASGIGILRTMYGDPDVVSDYVPVDIAIKGMIVSAYKTGIQTRSPMNELPIYNCSTSSLRAITTGCMIELAKEVVQKQPLNTMLWVPGGNITRSRILNYFRFIFFHVLIAYIADSLFGLIKQKPFLVKLQRKIYTANLALHYFATTHWVFVNDNFVSLEEFIPAQDWRSFSYLYLKDFDIKEYMHHALAGARRYLLKESDDTNLSAKTKFKRIYIMDRLMRLILWMFIIYYVLFKKINLYCTIQNK